MRNYQCGENVRPYYPVMKRIEEHVPLFHRYGKGMEYPVGQVGVPERRHLEDAVVDAAEITEVTGNRHCDHEKVQQEVADS